MADQNQTSFKMFCYSVEASPDHVVGNWKSPPEERRDHFNYGIVELWKPQEFLQRLQKQKSHHEHSSCVYLQHASVLCYFKVCVAHLCAVVAAVLDDPLHFLMDQLDAAQAGLLQTFDLPLHQQLKGNLWHKQRRPWALTKEFTL